MIFIAKIYKGTNIINLLIKREGMRKKKKSISNFMSDNLGLDGLDGISFIRTFGNHIP